MLRLLKLRSGTGTETRESNANADFIGGGQAAALIGRGDASPVSPRTNSLPGELVGQLSDFSSDLAKPVSSLLPNLLVRAQSAAGRGDHGPAASLLCPVGFYEKSFDGYELARHRADASPIFDEGTLTVTVGGSVSGVIDATGDVDTIEVTLVAGQTYLFSLVGSGATPVSDTFLTINAPGGALILEDDDGGNGTFSLITITAATSGVYTLLAESFANPGDPGTGGWTLTVIQQGADEAPSAPPSAVVAHLGDNYGFINPAGTDEDVYQITLTAGRIYNFSVAGGADYNTDFLAVPLGEIDTIIRIYDSAGNLIFENDDVDFPDDISSALAFLAETSGTYYVEIDGFSGQTGGYVLNITETDLSTLDPLDAIDWGGIANAVDNTDTLLIYFATAGQVFDGETSLGWTAYEQQQALAAFQTYSQFADLNFAITTNSALADFHLVTVQDVDYLGYFNPPGETNAGVGVFAIDGSGWDRNDTTGGLEPGGYGWITLIHEFGHGLGLAHPHDDGGGSEIMPGVTGPFGSYGIFDLNQGVYTTMSYNDGWQLHPNVDANGFPVPDTLDYGYQGTPMTLDIALIQLKYGAVSHNTGNNIYTLGTANVAGTYYQCIWDTGGTDEIAYVGAADCTIDLTAATLDYSATGAGVLSWVDGIFGGFTIAATVVIERATGGGGDDLLVGNSAANILTGNGGNDTFIGREGDDEIFGGAGSDTVVLSGNQADYTITAIAGGYTIEDNNIADGDDGLDTVHDVTFVQFANGTVNLEDAPGNQAPTLTGFAPSIAFNENVVNAGPQLLDGDVTFDDSDGNFNGGTLVVSGLLAEDIVGIRNEGSGAGQVGVSGANVTYGGVVIGTFTGGNGTTLTVTLNAAATSIAVDQLIENLTYANNSGDPTLNRTLTLNVTDSNGAGLGAPVFTPGPFVEQTGASDPLANPGRLATLDANPTLAIVDVNHDGDMDVVAGTVAGGLRYFENNGAGYTEVTGAANPFNGYDPTIPAGEDPGSGAYSSPCTIDIDGDGDLDLVIGTNYGLFDTFRNNGNGTWTQLIGAANPLNGISDPSFSDPTAIDYDGDGDIDIVAGSSYGDTYAIRNNGGGSWTILTGAGRPFAAAMFDVGGFSSHTSGDVDGDGDLDLVVGEASGILNVFLNNGGGTFVAATPAQNPWNGISFGTYSLPAFGDIDGDGDLDLIVGDASGGDTRVWLNTSTTTPGAAPTIQVTVNAQNDAPSGANNSHTIPENGSYQYTAADFGFTDTDNDAFASVVITTLPTNGLLQLNGVNVTAGQIVTVADVNAGLLDFVPDPNEFGTGYATWTFQVRDNGGTANTGVDTDQSANTMTVNVTPDNTAPTLTGLDASVTFLENTVNATPQILDADVTFNDAEGNFAGGSVTVSGALAEDTIGINNQGNGAGQIGVSGANVTYGGVIIGTVAGGAGSTLTVTLNAAATSAAVDALIQNLTYANSSDTPTASRTLSINVTDDEGLDLNLPGGFIEATGGADPLAGLPAFGLGPNLAFVDVNHDGDLDIVVGDQDGSLRYFEKNGATYTEVTGASNPFGGFVGETQGGATGSLYTAPCTIDIDGDGDLDLVVANNYGYFGTVRNNGNGTWTQLTGAANPLDGIVDVYFADPTAIDYDGDGDIDLVAGSSYGDLYAIRNDGGGNFTFVTGVGRPFGGAAFDVGSFSSAASGDVDGDGDLDLVVGEADGTINTFINNGGGTFVQAVGAANPFNGIDVGSYSIPTLVDIDGDGDADLIVGDNVGGDTRVFMNNTGGTPSITVNVTPEGDVFPVELYDAADNLVGTFSTIQSAIDAASNGYRLFLTAFTYDEDVIVNKDVTIEGPNAGLAGTDGTRGAEAIVNGSFTITANGVTIDGVEITGEFSSPSTGGFNPGVLVQGNNFVLINSVLDGPDGDFILDTVAVLVGGGVTGLDIGDNLIHGYLRGVYIVGSTTAGSVHDNLFQGDGFGQSEGMGNGINTETQLVIIEGNTFDGIWAGVINVGPTGTDPAHLATYILENFYSDVGARPIQVYPTNDVHEIFGTDENEAFSGDLAVTDNGVTNASFTFHGMGGEDHIYGHTMGDFLFGDDGNDRIFASGGSDSLNGGAGNDLLDGGAGIDTASFAGILNFTDSVIGWIAVGVDGNDVLQNVEIAVEGSGRRNLLVGSTGFGGIQVALDAALAGDAVRLAAGVYTGTWTYSDAGLTVLAQPGARINGSFLTAGTDGIVIAGANLADNITTGAGNDTLSGGGGADTLAGGLGNDLYIVDNAGDVVNEAAAGGSDTVVSSVSYTLTAGSEVELMTTGSVAGTGAIDLTGNGLANQIWGNAAANTLSGGGGNDILIGFGGNDTLFGGAGADTMLGGTGDDLYFVDDAGDALYETAGEGSDVIASSVSYTLTAGSSIELFTAGSVPGTGAIDLTGNELDNQIWGNDGVNVLNGGLGNDILIGFGGADTYAFTTALGAGNIDSVITFNAADDTIALDDAVFTALGLGALNANAFVVGTAAADADDRIIYDASNGALYYDADGNGAGAAVHFATLLGTPVITASDFTVI